MKIKLTNLVLAVTLVLTVITAVRAQSPSLVPASNAVPVTADNFNRAESDMYFAGIVKDGALGKFRHNRELMPVAQPIVRPNRDTLYSMSVFDLDGGPVTITLPDAGKRFMSLQTISEDAYTPAVVYGAGDYTFTRENIGTRYAGIGVRILVDPANPEDMKQVHALQDAIKVEQKSAGKFEIPNWDPVSQKKVRDALLALGATLPDLKGAFGARDRVDPVRFLIGTAMGWGGNPEKDATYINVTPSKNDGKTVHKLTVKEVPVDGFWSIIVYDAEGHLQPNPYNAYSLNNVTARKDADGSVTVQFGGCDQPSPSGSGPGGGKIPNCLPIVPGWNYMVRLYRPRPEILNGNWKFPVVQPISK